MAGQLTRPANDLNQPQTCKSFQKFKSPSSKFSAALKCFKTPKTHTLKVLQREKMNTKSQT